MPDLEVILDPATSAELTRRERLAFVDGAAAYQASMREAGQADRDTLLALADLEPDHELLDVCCGPGWLAIEAEQRFGLHATGIDLSPTMIELAVVQASRIDANATFAVMDATQLDFSDDTFDRVVCGWGLMHVPDPVAALREMARVTRQHGRFAASVWGPATDTIQGVLDDALRVGADGQAALDYGYLTRLGEERVAVKVLEQAGWSNVHVQPLRREVILPDADYVWHAMASGTTFGTIVADLDDRQQTAVHGEVVRRCDAFRAPDGIHVPFSQLLITATR